MLILITMTDYPKDRYGRRLGADRLYVSHGVDPYTGKNVCMPCEELEYYQTRYDVKFSLTYNEWVIYDTTPKKVRG